MALLTPDCLGQHRVNMTMNAMDNLFEGAEPVHDPVDTS
jgi:hypothetical protein